MTVVSSFITFPCVSWWMQVAGAGLLILDKEEHFQKMSCRNRYRVSGANNSILLTVPLEKGRDQRSPMAGIRIFNENRWQVQHWRTLVSVYRRSPFFDHYEASLKPLFEQQYTYLVDFDLATIEWVKQQLKLPFEVKITDACIKEYAGGVKDIRGDEEPEITLPQYYQVFEDRIGFQPNLSILDLLFSEGPAVKSILMGQ